MRDDSDSVNRRAEEYLLFALTFIGFLIAGSGIIVASSGIAFTGAMISLLALWCSLGRSSGKN